MKNRDLRKYSKQTNIRLIIGGILLIFIVGDGLIYYFYGQGAALGGLLCLSAGLVPVLLIIAILWLLERLAKRINPD